MDRFELLVGLAGGIVLTLIVLWAVRWWQQRSTTFTEGVSQREPLLKLIEVIVLFLALVTSAYSLYLFREDVILRTRPYVGVPSAAPLFLAIPKPSFPMTADQFLTLKAPGVQFRLLVVNKGQRRARIAPIQLRYRLGEDTRELTAPPSTIGLLLPDQVTYIPGLPFLNPNELRRLFINHENLHIYIKISYGLQDSLEFPYTYEAHFLYTANPENVEEGLSSSLEAKGT